MSESPIPNDKFDLAAIERARALGFPALNPHIPALLEWLQDPNWPVYQATADLLAEAGPPLLPPIRAVMNSADTEWIWSLLNGLCPRLPPDLFERLKPDIEGLRTRSDLRDHPDIPATITRLLAP